ncbi:MAG TPA: hypothetical protein VMV53_03640 [Acidimicrobiales bacterium]|nr:hypothetical protein [Acidimicrobiales bacterium]
MTPVLMVTLSLVAVNVSAPVSSAASASKMPDAAVSGCDVLMTAPARHSCLLPWPNDAFTIPSNKTATGRQLNISSQVDPVNFAGVHVDTTAENQGDGFSPGSTIMTYVPNLDLAKSNIATSTNIGLSLAPDSPIVILDTVTHTRVPYFAELDAQTTNTAEQLLLIHPAIALTEGHRYAVALRNLVDTGGNLIAPLPSTTAALAGTLTPLTRGAHIKWVIQNDLASVLGSTVPYQAWDFTVASALSIAGPALTMHKLAYQWLATHHRPAAGRSTTPMADFAPDYSVTSDTTIGGVRDVQGTFQVPLFLKDTTASSVLNTDRFGAPAINGNLTWTANFVCVMPSTVQAQGPAQPLVLGHGLFGSAHEVEWSGFSALVTDNTMGCATNYVGFSEPDIPNFVNNLLDMSGFNTSVDHMLQGLLNFQFLGRLINSPDGFVSNAAFQDSSGNALFQVGKCAYLGYSQGGIMGGAASALSTEWTRVVLGVGGMDYSGLLLDRSVDYGLFAPYFNYAYPNPVDQQIVWQIAQLIWDQGENDGYAQHLTSNPYPGIPAKQVFMIENYGDHQVANVATEMLARTIGAQNHQPAFNASFFGATPRTNVPVDPQWGLTALDQTKPASAGLVLWDYGTPTPPTNNLAPFGATYGADPHSDGRHNNVAGLTQITTFLATGVIPNVCGSAACQSSTP